MAIFVLNTVQDKIDYLTTASAEAYLDAEKYQRQAASDRAAGFEFAASLSLRSRNVSLRYARMWAREACGLMATEKQDSK